MMKSAGSQMSSKRMCPPRNAKVEAGFIPRHRQLPLQVRPLAAERLKCYLARVCARNLLAVASLEKFLRRPGFRGTLAEFTGYSERHLASALPELREPSDLELWPYLVGKPSRNAQVRPACTFCVAARLGERRRIPVFASHEQLICATHLRWLGDAEIGRNHEQQFSIANCPDILRANRAHTRLIQRWGRGPARASFDSAFRCLAKWSEWPDVVDAPDIRRRRRELGVTEYRIYPYPKVVAAWYPNAVALTEIILTLRQKVVENHRLTPEIDAAGIAEFQKRVIPGFEPTGARNPYHRAIREDWVECRSEVEVGGLAS